MWSGGPHLHVLPVLGPWGEQIALLDVRPYHAAEATGGMANASRKDLAVQEGIYHRALPVAGTTKKGNLGRGQDPWIRPLTN